MALADWQANNCQSHRPTQKGRNYKVQKLGGAIEIQSARKRSRSAFFVSVQQIEIDLGRERSETELDWGKLKQAQPSKDLGTCFCVSDLSSCPKFHDLTPMRKGS